MILSNTLAGSPDGETIYTEHPNLPCGSIIQLTDKKLFHAYETDQLLYYKGILDEKRFYGTQKLILDEKRNKKRVAEDLTNTKQL